MADLTIRPARLEDIDTVVQRAAAAGARGLRLYVEVENRRAQATYTAIGMHHARYQLYELGEE